MFPPRHREKAGKIEWPVRAIRAWHQVIDALLEGGLVAMLGNRGTGKTQMATDIASSLVHHHGHSAMYWRVADLISDFRTKVYVPGQSEHTELRRLSRIGLLVIDEMQERRDTTDEDRIITRLLDHRYGEAKATLLISNQSPNAMAEALGPSVTDRLRETGVIVECNWESFR